MLIITVSVIAGLIFWIGLYQWAKDWLLLAGHWKWYHRCVNVFVIFNDRIISFFNRLGLIISNIFKLAVGIVLILVGFSIIWFGLESGAAFSIFVLGSLGLAVAFYGLKATGEVLSKNTMID